MASIPNSPDVECIDINGAEAARLLLMIKKLQLDQKYDYNYWNVDEIYKINTNKTIQQAYEQRKAQLGPNSREILAFACAGKDKVVSIARDGVVIESNRHVVGDTNQGINLCFYPDVQLKEADSCNCTGVYLLVFMVAYCKHKNVEATEGNAMQPDPKYDCHVSLNLPTSGEPICDQIRKSQIYLYEHGENGAPVQRPRQVFPLVVFHFLRKCKPAAARVCVTSSNNSSINFTPTATPPILMPSSVKIGERQHGRPVNDYIDLTEGEIDETNIIEIAPIEEPDEEDTVESVTTSNNDNHLHLDQAYADLLGASASSYNNGNEFIPPTNTTVTGTVQRGLPEEQIGVSVQNLSVEASSVPVTSVTIKNVGAILETVGPCTTVTVAKSTNKAVPSTSEQSKISGSLTMNNISSLSASDDPAVCGNTNDTPQLDSATETINEEPYKSSNLPPEPSTGVNCDGIISSKEKECPKKITLSDIEPLNNTSSGINVANQVQVNEENSAENDLTIPTVHDLKASEDVRESEVESSPAELVANMSIARAPQCPVHEPEASESIQESELEGSPLSPVQGLVVTSPKSPVHDPLASESIVETEVKNRKGPKTQKQASMEKDISLSSGNEANEKGREKQNLKKESENKRKRKYVNKSSSDDDREMAKKGTKPKQQQIKQKKKNKSAQFLDSKDDSDANGTTINTHSDSSNHSPEKKVVVTEAAQAGISSCRVIAEVKNGKEPKTQKRASVKNDISLSSGNEANEKGREKQNLKKESENKRKRKYVNKSSSDNDHELAKKGTKPKQQQTKLKKKIMRVNFLDSDLANGTTTNTHSDSSNHSPSVSNEAASSSTETSLNVAKTFKKFPKPASKLIATNQPELAVFQPQYKQHQDKQKERETRAEMQILKASNLTESGISGTHAENVLRSPENSSSINNGLTFHPVLNKEAHGNGAMTGQDQKNSKQSLGERDSCHTDTQPWKLIPVEKSSCNYEESKKVLLSLYPDEKLDFTKSVSQICPITLRKTSNLKYTVTCEDIHHDPRIFPSVQENKEKQFTKDSCTDKTSITSPNIQEESPLKFRGEGHPLSNFFPVNDGLVVNGVTFHTSEAAYVYEKARYHNDLVTAEDARKSTSGIEAKSLGDKIETNERWENQKINMMDDIIRSKFESCEAARKLLTQSGDRPIIEDTPREFWGRGRNNSGKNMLGHLWMIYRKKLSGPTRLAMRNSQPRCYKCGKPGHLAKQCSTSKAVSCYKCGNPGHLAKQCSRSKAVSCYKCGILGHKRKHCGNTSPNRKRNTLERRP